MATDPVRVSAPSLTAGWPVVATSRRHVLITNYILFNSFY